MDYEQKPDPMLLGLIRGRQVNNGLNQSLSNWMNKGSISHTRSDDQIGQNLIKNAKNGSTNMSNPSPVPSFNNWMNKGLISHTRPENQISQNLMKNVTFPRKNPELDSKTEAAKFATKNQEHVKLMIPGSTTPTKPRSWLKRTAKANEEFHPSKMKKIEESLFCELCQINCSGPIVMRQHLIGRQHKAKMEYRKLKRGGTTTNGGDRKGKPMCDVCEIWCSDRDALHMHFKGHKHNTKVKQVEASTKNIGGHKGKSSLVMCELCHVPCMNQDLYQMHLKGKQHAQRNHSFGTGLQFCFIRS